MQAEFTGTDFSKFHTLAFDLDGTLAVSKQKMQADIANSLCKLSRFFHIAIVSGGDWPQFEKQVLPAIQQNRWWEENSSFSMYPTCGAKQYRLVNRTSESAKLTDKLWNKSFGMNSWEDITGGAYCFGTAEVKELTGVIEKAVEAWAHKPSTEIWGAQLENRGTQLTYSALGQEAPPEAKAGWDDSTEKRSALKAELEKLLGNGRYSVRIGGTTSIDITKAGIDKGFAMRSIAKGYSWRGNAEAGILFIGDALFEGGNDRPAADAGCAWKQVSGPDQTDEFLKTILVNL